MSTIEHFITVERGVRVYVNDINPGGRKPILFMHGWPASYELWEYQYNYLMQADYRCIGMDVRGFGRSDKPVFGYDYNRSADDIRAVIDTLRLRNITLIGHSTAGAVAIRYMARHRGHGVARLILAAAAAPSLIQRPGFPYGQPESDILAIIQGLQSDRPATLQQFGSIFFYKPISDAFASWFLNIGMEAASWSTLAVANSWLSETLFEDMSAIRVPTLIMHGIHDQVCLYQLGQVMNRGIKDSKLVTFEDSGHGLFYDEKDKFNHEIVWFVS